MFPWGSLGEVTICLSQCSLSVAVTAHRVAFTTVGIAVAAILNPEHHFSSTPLGQEHSGSSLLVMVKSLS